MSFIMIDRVRARERGDLGVYIVVHATAAAIAKERLHTGAGHHHQGRGQRWANATCSTGS